MLPSLVLWASWLPRAPSPPCAHARHREPRTDTDDAGSSIVQSLIVQRLRSSAKNPSVKAGVGRRKHSVALTAAQVRERGNTFTISVLCCFHDATKRKMRSCQVRAKRIVPGTVAHVLVSDANHRHSAPNRVNSSG